MRELTAFPLVGAFSSLSIISRASSFCCCQKEMLDCCLVCCTILNRLATIDKGPAGFFLLM
jgi:hypothetical protein